MDITKFALFKKMAGGSGGGGGGAELPTLNAPSIKIYGDTLTITNPASNGNFVEYFAILNNGSMIASSTETTVDLSTKLTEYGTYSISVIAKSTNFIESPPSVSLEYTRVDPSTSIESATWAEIAAAAETGAAQTMWKVGDTKTITLSTGKTVKAQIIGFNHDDLADGTGKAGITFQLDSLLSGINCSTIDDGWKVSGARNTLTNTYLPQLPEELQSVMKTVKKLTANGGKYASSQGGTVSIEEAEDKLFFLSIVEIFGTGYRQHPSTNYLARTDEGTQYEYYAKSKIPEGFVGLNGNTGTFYAESELEFVDNFGNVITTWANYYYNLNAIKAQYDASSTTSYATRSPSQKTKYYVCECETRGLPAERNGSYATAFNFSYAFCV